MKRIWVISALVLLIIGCTITGFFVGTTSAQYRATTELERALEGPVNALEMDVGTLHLQPRELQVHRFTGFVSTTDRSGIAPDWMARSRAFENHLEVGFSKPWPNSYVHPEMRLAFGATTNFEYIIDVPSQFGSVVDVWLSRTSPKALFDSFDEFDIKWQSTNSLSLIARLKPNTSVGMEFEILILSVAPVRPPGH